MSTRTKSSGTKKRSAKKRSTEKRSAKKRSGRTRRKYCYFFGAQRTDGTAQMRELLGGKGANLAEMCNIGLPVPPGFTITTETCAEYLAAGTFPDGLLARVGSSLKRIESETGKRFGGKGTPLLLSVRSGAAVSMPGMMDSVLNLGLNGESVQALARATDNERFAYDAYRRLINMFANVVMGVPHEHFEKAFDRIKKRRGVTLDAEVDAAGLRALCKAYEKVYLRRVGSEFPQDPHEQLGLAIEAVFKSWNKPTAVSYRRINEIAALAGTAVNVQAMVYGNTGDDSATGVAFTRDPATGDNHLYGEFLINAQGEDVVAGIRTPLPIDQLAAWNPQIQRELARICKVLEKHFRDMQDVEFTVERGKLYMLQTRTGKRTGAAGVRIAVEMVKQKLINRKTAVGRVPAGDLAQLLLPSFAAADKRNARCITRGLPASPGAATGQLAFSADEAVARAQAGEQVLLVRKDTSPEDVDGMHHAAGILTSTGGMTSHAAVVARGWGKCCVVGAGELVIDAGKGELIVAGHKLGRGTTLSIDGATGEVLLGEIALTAPSGVTGDFATLMSWADDVARMTVRANADTPEDARRARELGAVGIGLCRTEHMFFGDRRISAMREMILADTKKLRQRALRRLLPFQRKDFIAIFTEMAGLPVTVRLLDPPLHEFLPHTRTAQHALALELGVSARQVERRVAALKESNPMLGHRGCRLAITYPEILHMQVTAIAEATIACKRKKIRACPEIMIPLVTTRRELELLRGLAENSIAETRVKQGYRGKLEIPIGTMIEVPRAALTAHRIAREADFFSFGTNDLTQMTYGFSRDDINSFLPDYLDHNILDDDPFQSIDQHGVGALVDIAVASGRSEKPNLKIGVCGEHGGDPKSVRFFHSHALDYVSCSPFRVPIARLAVAQAVLEAGG
jgi:pyruvate,orthophosphate dikinase